MAVDACNGYGVACEGSDAPYNGYVETTQDNAATLVLKGYENPQAGFTVFEPDGFQSPFYIQDKTFYGKQYAFVKSTSTRLDEMKNRPEADAWQAEGVPVVDGATYCTYRNAGCPPIRQVPRVQHQR